MRFIPSKSPLFVVFNGYTMAANAPLDHIVGEVVTEANSLYVKDDVKKDCQSFLTELLLAQNRFESEAHERGDVEYVARDGTPLLHVTMRFGRITLASPALMVPEPKRFSLEKIFIRHRPDDSLTPAEYALDCAYSWVNTEPDLAGSCESMAALAWAVEEFDRWQIFDSVTVGGKAYRSAPFPKFSLFVED